MHMVHPTTSQLEPSNRITTELFLIIEYVAFYVNHKAGRRMLEALVNNL